MKTSKFSANFAAFVWSALFALFLCAHRVDADLVISEFLASNKAGLQDEDGAFSDWLEVRNTGTSVVNLGGKYLTDLKTNPTQWAFPDMSLGADAYLLVFASSKNRRDPSGNLHTNFSLKAGGEYLGLYDSDGLTVLSEYAPTFPVQTDDRSYGIDSTGAIRYFSSPSPGTANGIGDPPMAFPVTASVNRGFYTSPFSVVLSTVQTGGTVRYTLDGTEPTSTNGIIYSAPISVSTTTILRAATFASGLAPSPVITNTYIFLAQVIQQPRVIAGFPNGVIQSTGSQGNVPNDMEMDPVIVNGYSSEIIGSMSAIPTMSMVGSIDDIFGSSGFYFTVDTEKKVSIEMLHANTTENTQVNCGAEGHSHDRLKRSLKINFRTDYGLREWDTTLLRNHAPVNGATAKKKQRTLVLRGGNNRCWARDWNPDKTSYTEDEFYRATFTAMNNGVGSHGTFVHLYLNGVYWGVYNVVERPDQQFAAIYFGGDDNDWFYTNHGAAGTADPTRWNYLKGALADKNMAISTNYAEMKQYLDVQSFADYLLAAFYIGLTDWPDNNWYVYLRMDSSPLGPTPAQFSAWDGEWSLNARKGGGRGATIPTAFTSCSGSTAVIVKLFCSLRKSTEFMALLSARLDLHTAPGGALTTNIALETWDALNNYIDSAIVGESARWGDSLWDLGGQFAVRRTRDLDWRNNNADIRSILEGNTVQLINAMKAAGFYTAQTPANPPASTPVSVPVNPPASTPVSVPTPVMPPVSAPMAPPVAPPVPSSEITLTLFNAATDLSIGPLTDGSVINLASVGTSLNIVATLSVATGVGSVVFTYDGAIFGTENKIPYSMAGDTVLNGITNYKSWTPKVGTHSLKVTAYSASNGGGTQLSTLTISFSVVNSGATPVSPPATLPVAPPVAAPVATPVAAPVSPPVASPVTSPVSPPVSSSGWTFTLINAATDQSIGPLLSGAVINRATVGTSLTIVATPSVAGVGSVRFIYDSGVYTKNENASPYSLKGDTVNSNGTTNYSAYPFTAGVHNLEVAAYSATGGTGTKLSSATISFTVE